MATCGCKFYGNQHGSFYRFCEKHGPMFEQAAALVGEPLQDLFNRIIMEYCERLERG